MNSRWKTGIIAVLVSVVLTGCSLTAVPSELVKAPKLDINKQEIKQAVENYLPGNAELTIPINPQHSSAIKQCDVDGDGSNELFVFYKKVQNSKFGAVILEKSGEQWEMMDNIEEFAKEIDYAGFHDIAGDKIPEFIIGWSGGSSFAKKLSVYTMEDQKIKCLTENKYVDLSIGDLNKNGKADIALMYKDNNKKLPISVVELYEYKDGKLKMTHKKEYEGYPEQVVIGNTSQEMRGIFVDIGLGAHSALTQLAVLRGDKLVNVFEQNKTFKPYPLPSKDINSDGNIEIGMQTQPPGTEDLCMAEIPWINTWYQWGGKDDLVRVAQDYADYGEGYRFEIPQNWTGKFTIKSVLKKEDFTVQAVSFYYTGQSEDLVKLLTIDYVTRENWPGKEKELKEDKICYSVIGENGDKVFVGIIPSGEPNLSNDDLQEYKQMFLDEKEIKQAFEMINR